MVGQLPLRETPCLNIVYDEPGLQVYLADIGNGELTMHTKADGPFTKSRMKWLETVFLQIILGLYERGMREVATWIEYGDEKQARFAEFFGFQHTGYLKVIPVGAGEVLFEEMIYTFPIDEE
jgi:hypothetical protein